MFNMLHHPVRVVQERLVKYIKAEVFLLEEVEGGLACIGESNLLKNWFEIESIQTVKHQFLPRLTQMFILGIKERGVKLCSSMQFIILQCFCVLPKS